MPISISGIYANMTEKRKQGYSRKNILRLIKMIVLPLLLCFGSNVYSQVKVAVAPDSLATDSLKVEKANRARRADNPATQYDLGNLYTTVLHPNKKREPNKKSSGITVIPNVAANPSIGAQAGIKAVAGRKLGNDSTTFLSVAATSASITTKGIIYFYINHNIYTSGNKWNFQGNLVAARSVTPDYGLGIGKPSTGNLDDRTLANGERTGRALHSQYYDFREKVYKEIEKGLFVGAGVSFDIRRAITQSNPTDTLTPYTIYNARHGFANDHYMANGLFFNMQYTTRDNQNRAYKGMYLDAGFRVNQTWMGSSKSSAQFTTDFRKYFSLSSLHPQHVIAIWNWGSYLLAGNVPYLELPGTAKDGSFRSGRGYTTGYFKGTKYNYSEVEYRFPILRNNFISGVGFFNLQTANDESGTKIFQQFQPGYGGGLRILLNKVTRTNLCMDYAFGRFGAKGFFLGLNEAF
jgi:hypothetical protein